MRHRKRTDLQRADAECIVAIEAEYMLDGVEAIAQRSQRAESRPHRDAVARRELRYAVGVIGMFVRDENCRQRTRQKTQPAEPHGRIARAKTAVDHHACAAGFDDETIALAAAAERGKAHWL